MITFREIIHRCHNEKRTQPPWHYAHRLVALPITWLCCKLPISPNLISVLMILMGLAGSAALVPDSLTLNVAGFVLFYLAYLLDKVDGDVARWRQQESSRGLILDHAYHRLVMFAFFTALGLHDYRITGDVKGLAAAFTVGFLGNYLQDSQAFPYRAYAQYLLCKREPWRIRPLPENQRLLNREFWVKPLKVFKYEPVMFVAAILLYRWPEWMSTFFYVAAGSLLLFILVQHAILFFNGIEAEIAYIHRCANQQPMDAQVSHREDACVKEAAATIERVPQFSDTPMSP